MYVRGHIGVAIGASDTEQTAATDASDSTEGIARTVKPVARYGRVWHVVANLLRENAE